MNKSQKHVKTKNSKVRYPETLEDINQLVDLYRENKPIISSFYQLNKNYSGKELRKKAIGGNTFRAFHRKDKTSMGMSCYFENTVVKYISENPTSFEVQKRIISELKTETTGKFRNWGFDANGEPKYWKLYNLYANYWVANNLAGNLNSKISSIKALKVPLDQYSLTFIRNLYNSSNTVSAFNLPKNLSMGSVRDMSHYESINSFIDKLAIEVNALLKAGEDEFFPIYLDIIQASKNNLDWYSRLI